MLLNESPFYKTTFQQHHWPTASTVKGQLDAG